MRKLLIIVLLSLVSTSQVGYYFVYSFHEETVKEEARERMRAGLSEKDLQVIILEDNKDMIVWKEKGREFYLHNNLYDISRTETRDGKTCLFCISDTKEKELVASLAKLVNADQHENGKAPRHTVKFEFPEFLPVKFSAIKSPDIAPGFLYPGYTARLYTVPGEIQCPPPQAS